MGPAVIDALFDAVIEATEEAIVNALIAAETMTGRDGVTAHALPHDRLLEVMAPLRAGSATDPVVTENGARQKASPGTRLRAAPGQPAATGAGFSIGTPIRLPYSVHEPS